MEEFEFLCRRNIPGLGVHSPGLGTGSVRQSSSKQTIATCHSGQAWRLYILQSTETRFSWMI